MHALRRFPIALCGLLALAGAAAAEPYAPVVEGSAAGIEGRLERIERLMSSRGIFDLADQVERLNREVKRLRGELELQAHSLDRLDERTRKWSDELGRRPQPIEGDAGAGEPAPLGAIEPAPQSQPAPEPPATAAAEPPPPPPREPARTESGGPRAADAGPAAPGEEDAYRTAFNQLKTGRYDGAVAAFSDFLARYPGSSHADNAQYWLAEAHYVAHEYQPAIAEYNKLVQNYPESQKLTHAMLKIGYSYHELGQLAEAKTSLETLRVRYPGTTAAQLAEERLQRIQVEQQ